MTLGDTMRSENKDPVPTLIMILSTAHCSSLVIISKPTAEDSGKSTLHVIFIALSTLEMFLRQEASIFFTNLMPAFKQDKNARRDIFDISSYHSACSSFLLSGQVEWLSDNTSLLLSSAPKRKRKETN